MTNSKENINQNRRACLAGVPAAAATVALGASQVAAQTSPRVATGRRLLGNLEVSERGLGVQNMHRTFYTIAPDRDEMIRLIRSAYKHGVTFFDCAEVYGPFACERILGEAMAPFRNDIQVTIKFGFAVDPETGVWDFAVTSQPERFRRPVEGSLKRLGTDRIDLLYQHRVDQRILIDEATGLIASETLALGVLGRFPIRGVEGQQDIYTVA
ncbi:aldo/keto reductase [Roseobacter litoralis]|uniref:aldo/keto reductase n=1 Tax=Roseobacter litoralis TaxID=42443 RepID=UPI002490ADCD|nr:aldo/keto reductase [Roseobacter litoralis]